MGAPVRYVSWVNEHIGFNPRAQEHSNALCSYLDEDLRLAIPSLREYLKSRNLVLESNTDVPPEGGPRSRNIDMAYRREANDGEVVMAVENKTIMTAHGRARKNRLGDLIAYCMHLHNHHPQAVAGFTVVINAAERYRNPDEFSEVAKHKALLKPLELEATIQLFREVPLRGGTTGKADLPEALGILVVEYDGERPARLLTEPPAPRPGDLNHYSSFIALMRDRFVERFG